VALKKFALSAVCRIRYKFISRILIITDFQFIILSHPISSRISAGENISAGCRLGDLILFVFIEGLKSNEQNSKRF